MLREKHYFMWDEKRQDSDASTDAGVEVVSDVLQMLEEDI